MTRPATTGRRLRRLNIALLGALWLGALLYWGSLPDRVPVHFDARGPDAWTMKSYAAWFLLPIIALFTTGIMFLSTWAVRRNPRLLNIPRRRQLLELPPEERAPILDEVAALLEAATTAMLLIVGIIQLATYRAALGLSVEGLMMLVLLIAVAGLPLLIVLLLIRTSARIDAVHRAARARGVLEDLG
ncbi:MAG TPA: DUF1648 domain-containing protein [Longimicrobiales bacterium]|nr:DUF1648 domain-containing protein [Longimicrobiales bacterium]